MTGRRIGVRALAIGLAAMTAGAALTAPTAPATAAPPSDPGRPVVAGDGWRVEPAGGRYRITLRLAERVPMRDALPVLAVDGRPVGAARQSADGRTFTLLSSDHRVATARAVGLLWSGGSVPAATPQRRQRTGVPSLRPRGTTLPVDPGTPGRYQVRTMEYDLGDQAVQLPGIGHRGELRGRVYAPVDAFGARPLVLFLHGRHESCFGAQPPPDAPPWPCPRGSRPVPSHRGYDAPARALASHGYQVVSISANAINAWDFDAFDAGALARAQLVLAHLDLWRRWSILGGGPFGLRFVGKVNLANVGLMGHSRGGEGVVRAALLNAERRLPYGIRAVLPLAPTDFTRPTLPGVAMSVLLPYCDGDVFDLEGQHYYDDTRYAASDRSARSAVLLMGANHNYFNTEWTPGQSAAPSMDDWSYGAATAECGARHPARLKATEQQAAGRAYVAGFFRLHLGGERRLLPLLDGSDTRAASAGRAVVRVIAQPAAPYRLDLDRFDRPLPAGAVTGRATARVCAGARLETVPLPIPAPCLTAAGQGNVPHWTPAAFVATSPTTAVTRLAWTGTDGRVRLALPPGHRDVRRYSALTFRAATAAGRPDLTVRVTDGRGRTAAVAVSAVSDALAPLPGHEEWILPKTMLRTVRIPLAVLRGLNLRDVRTVELRTDRTASGAVFLSDLAFGRPSVGHSGPSRLPRLSVPVDVRMAEGNTGTRTADFTVVMSRPSRQPVSVHAELFGELGPAITPVSRRVVFAPGQTRATVSVPVRGNTRDDEDNRFSLVLSVPRNALVADSFATGTILDDDPEPRISVGPAVADERARVLRFPMRLSAPSNRDTGVSGLLVDGTALAGRDYLSVYDDGEAEPERYADGALAPGETTGWIEVPVLDDTLPEPTETLTLDLTPVNAVLSGPTTIPATIRDND